MKFPEIEGTAKQIKFAEDIRRKQWAEYNRRIEEIKNHDETTAWTAYQIIRREGAHGDDEMPQEEIDAMSLEYLEEYTAGYFDETDAKEWIEHRQFGDDHSIFTIVGKVAKALDYERHEIHVALCDAGKVEPLPNGKQWKHFDRMKSKVRTYRIAAKMTQEELSKKLGVSLETVANWETGDEPADIVDKVRRLI